MTAGPEIDVADRLSRSRGTMTDATAEMSGGEMAEAVTRVMAFLDEQDIAPADGVAFTCGNNLPSAIVLLALLASGRTFALLPSSVSAGAACRYHLQIRARFVAPDATVPQIAMSQRPTWQADVSVAPARLLVPTSGSTGHAKNVRHRHDRLWRAAGHCADRLGLGPGDRVAVPVPIAHMFGLGAAFLPAMLAGASIDLQSGANALRYLARERHFGPTVAFLTPAFGDTLTRVRKRPRRYRLTVMAGDRLPAELFDRYERLHGCLVNLYGSTELGVIAAGDPADPAALRRDVIGRPMPGVAIGHGERASPCAEPEMADVLWVRHEHGFEGYVGADGAALPGPDDPPASGAWCCTNDVGQVIDGYVSVHGRADDFVNRDGLLVGCGDVADAILANDGIAEACVLGGEMTRRGRALIAYCVAAPEWGGDLVALRKACVGVLPSRSVPDEFIIVPSLPRLPSGKVDRAALSRGEQLT